MSSSHAFDDHVQLKYEIYNSLFLTLPVDGIHKTGIFLPIFHDSIKRDLLNGVSPRDAIIKFFAEHTQLTDSTEQLDFLFRVVQYVERQVVLVDALEDAAFDKINDLDGPFSLGSWIDKALASKGNKGLLNDIHEQSIRLVLTAHPTQFYPGHVLAIITDLTEAIQRSSIPDIRQLLLQLGKTPFFRKEKPTPFDEAVSLIWYLENIFYHAAPRLLRELIERTESDWKDVQPLPWVRFGFWPGGDRDGNPFVNSNTTLRVAEKLRRSVLLCHYRELRRIKRRLSFKGVYERLDALEKRLYLAANGMVDERALTWHSMIEEVEQVIVILREQHEGLFLDKLLEFAHRIRLFGFHFATIDIRQDSRVIEQAVQEWFDAHEEWPSEYSQWSNARKITWLFNRKADLESDVISDPVLRDTVESFRVMRRIQEDNGPEGCHRYIISNCRSALDIARVFAIALCSGPRVPDFDIVPLFETIEDLVSAREIMTSIFNTPKYRDHLAKRGNKQTVMLGFSDGTKDGGYLSANWNIFKAKEALTELAKLEDIEIAFFDGRGGPPARGGGNTHKFYASLGPSIANKDIQLTIQGQTISSNFGTITSAKHNLETLMTAGLMNKLKQSAQDGVSSDDVKLFDEISIISEEHYRSLKAHPQFMDYLLNVSPLKYFSEANIGSRPSKRGKSSTLKFEDLRAIPFVGAWAQLKQNVPGWYGVGKALEELEMQGRLDEAKDLYKRSLFFRTLIDNSMQSLCKTFFPLTSYLTNDPVFGEIRSIIEKEYLRSHRLVLAVAGQNDLMAANPSIRSSIQLRESIILPLIAIQQYALQELRDDKENKLTDNLKQLVIRTMYGVINAGRNSA